MSPFVTRRLKHVADVRFSNVDKLSEPDETPVRLCNYTDVYNNERIVDEMPFMAATATAVEIRRFGLEVGDVILTKDSESPTDIAVPAVVVSTAPDLVCGYHLAMARPRRGVLLGRYLQRALQADGIRQQFYVSANGVTRFGLSQDAIGNVLLPLPPVCIQEAIADFLDTKTAAIDALIEKQERLLALLAEKRQVVITQAVTKGLDPSVPMRDSGVDWIGRVPAHWDVAPLGARYDVQLGKMLDATRDDGDGEFPYLRNANIQWGKIDIDDIKRMSLSARDREKYRLVDGDLLVCEGGANINVVAKSAIWRGELAECYYQKALHRLRPRRAGESPAFLLQSLWAAWAQGVFIAGANPNTVFHLTAVKLRAHRVPFPPAAEQLTIGAHLKAALALLDGVVVRLRERADRLREYRQALITAAVTGKLDISARQPEAARA